MPEWSSANTRFSKRIFDVARDWSRANRTVYACPACGHESAVVLLDLVRRENAGEAQAAAGFDDMAAAVPEVLAAGADWRLGFTCPGCGGRRLVLYSATGGPVGRKVFHLLWVVEESAAGALDR